MAEEQDRTWRIALPVVAAIVVLSVAWPTAHVELGLGAAAAMVAGLAAAVPVALAGLAPAPAWLLSALGGVLVAVGSGPGATGLAVPTAHVVALLGLLLVVGLRCAPWVVAVAGVGTAAVLVIGVAPASVYPLVLVVIAMVLVVAVLGRQLLGSRRALARSEELTAQERARAAVLEERGRIARDLHDVVAHSMSLVVVRAQTARHRVPGVSDEVTAELAAIADTARGALGELRGVLGVLRTDGERSDRPQPGPGDVDELLETTRGAGVDLTVTRGGDLEGAGAAVTLSLYRILAEALANAARHAGGAPVTVLLERGDGAVRLRVDNPPGRDVAGPGSGLGLTAMRERAAAVGGELRAGPVPEGFVVEAELPVGRPAVPAALEARGVTRVLVADDQAMVREGFGALLDAQDGLAVVGHAADGQEAVERVDELVPDVVLMDVRMPRLDGLAATRAILGRHTAVRVLVLTTFDVDDYVYEALRAGASGFLLKDAPAEDLVRAVRVVAAGEALLAPSVTRRLVAEFAARTVTGRADPARLAVLTPREREVLGQMARGLSNAEIAAGLVLSEQTVKTHVGHVLGKLGLRDRAQAVVLAYETGLVVAGG